VNDDAIHRLVGLGLSEHEARVYLVLLTENPLSGCGLADLLEMPRSTIQRAVESLRARGAVMTLPADSATLYAPVPAGEFLDRLRREHEALVGSLKEDLSLVGTTHAQDCVWTIAGQANIVSRAREMIARAKRVVYIGLLPAALPSLESALAEAIERGVKVVVYTTGRVEVPGGRVVVTPLPPEALVQNPAAGIMLVKDQDEALIGQWHAADHARASWTQSPTIVSIAEHYLLHGGRRRFMLGGKCRQED
jgi:sugar-specific transcriptional regulator TrmB